MRGRSTCGIFEEMCFRCGGDGHRAYEYPKSQNEVRRQEARTYVVEEL
jgi:hypothetical protein